MEAHEFKQVTVHVKNADSDKLEIRLVGDLIMFNAAHVRRKLMELIEKDGYAYVVFDLSEMSGLDSSGIGMLAGLSKSLRKAGGQLLLAGVKSEIQEIISVTGLDSFFTYAD